MRPHSAASATPLRDLRKRSVPTVASDQSGSIAPPAETPSRARRAAWQPRRTGGKPRDQYAGERPSWPDVLSSQESPRIVDLGLENPAVALLLLPVSPSLCLSLFRSSPHRQKIVVIEEHVHQVFARPLVRVGGGRHRAGGARGELCQRLRVGETLRLLGKKLLALGTLVGCRRAVQHLGEGCADEG